jgi:hypothetical protein
MRGLTVADGSFHADPVVVGFGSALSTAFLAWLGTRLVGKAAIQSAVNQTFHEQTAIFKELLDQVRIELKESILALRDSDQALNAARTENMHLQAEIRQKDAIIAGFERTMVAPHGRRT